MSFGKNVLPVLFVFAAAILVAEAGFCFDFAPDESQTVVQNERQRSRLELELPELDLEDEDQDDQEQQEKDQKQQKEQGDTDAESGRVELPKFEEEKDEADTEVEAEEEVNIEQLLADSEAMRIEFEEKMRRCQDQLERSEVRSQQFADSTAYYRDTVVTDLKSESSQMQTQLARLRRENKRLRQHLASASDGLDTAQLVKIEDGADTRDADTEKEVEKPEQKPARLLDPNTASLDKLKNIEGLSPRLAGRIKWYREDIRRFGRRKDLRRVPGIDTGLYEKIKHYFRPGSYE
ncbi:MAG: helix-hairpin-helix domain-containing protein [bacterium]